MKQLSKAYIEKYSEPCPATGCWLWRGELNREGYGIFKVRIGDGKRVKYSAHRVSYEVFVGPLLNGAYACHTCDVRSCVNPGHIYAGSHKRNMEDMAVRGGGKVSHPGAPKREFCRRGHAMTPENRLGALGRCKTCRKAYKLAKYGHVRR